MSRGERAALCFAVLVAVAAYLRIPQYPPEFDAQTYLQIARDIAANGLFRDYHYSKLRTYGYPVFLVACQQLAGALRLDWTVVVFAVQFGFIVLAALFLRAAVSRHSPALARIVFVAVVVNPFLLLLAPETLSEALSVALLITGAACWAAMLDRSHALLPP